MLILFFWLIEICWLIISSYLMKIHGLWRWTYTRICPLPLFAVFPWPRMQDSLSLKFLISKELKFINNKFPLVGFWLPSQDRMTTLSSCLDKSSFSTLCTKVNLLISVFFPEFILYYEVCSVTNLNWLKYKRRTKQFICWCIWEANHGCPSELK